MTLDILILEIDVLFQANIFKIVVITLRNMVILDGDNNTQKSEL